MHKIKQYIDENVSIRITDFELLDVSRAIRYMIMT